MKKMMKRWLTTLLAFSIVLGTLSVTAFAFDEGLVAVSVAGKERGEGYQVTYHASYTMSDDMAEAAAVAQGNQQLKNVRITCVLECPLLEGLKYVDMSALTFADPKGIYEFVEAKVTEKGIAMTYRISDNTLTRWENSPAKTIKDDLKMTLTMEATQDATKAEVQKALNADGKLRVTGRVEITYGEKEMTVLSNTAFWQPVQPAPGQPAPGQPAPGLADPAVTGVSSWLNTQDHTAFMQGDDVGFRPNANVTRAEVAMIFYRLLKNQDVNITVSFPDVAEDAWYADAVETLASLGIIKGMDDGQFAPNRAIKRSEFAAICSRFAKASTGSEAFVDVPVSHWAYANIMTCASYGWVNGVGDGTFQPDRSISRAEAATMVNRMLGRLPDAVAIDAGQGRQFADVAKNHWARYQIAEATTNHDYTMNAGRTEETWIR